MTGRVLVIEDDDAMRASLTQSLELEGLTVLQANGLAQARRSIRANFSGVVLSDIRMPGADGFDVLARVKEVDDELPVVFLTGEADVPMAVRALQSGVYDFLEKPCSVEALLRVVKRALAHRELVLQTRRLESALENSDAAAVHFPGSTTASIQLRRHLRNFANLKTHVHLHGIKGAGRRLAAHTLHFLSDDKQGAVVISVHDGIDRLQSFSPETLKGKTLILKNIELATDAQVVQLFKSVLTCSETRVFTTSTAPIESLPRWRSGLERLGEVASIEVPDLWARRADLPVILENLVRQAARNLDADMPDIPTKLIEKVTADTWRGNFPELRHEARTLVLGANQSGDKDRPSLSEQMAAFEKSLLIDALKSNAGVASRAAEHLGLPRKTFYDKLTRHGIDPKALK